MTRYAIHVDHNELTAGWFTGQADTAITVAVLPTGCPPALARTLAATLSRLSEALWACYTHPASASRSTAENTEGWRRQASRDAFADVADALHTPNQPGDGALLVSYDPVEESAHGVGRALHAIGDQQLSRTVADHVQTEIDAVEAAERGDLSGRARQAVLLTRESISPTQVAVAHQVLYTNPLGGIELFVEVDPAAASAALAHWLRAAASVIEDIAGIPAVQALIEADSVEALPHTTPTAVLHMIEQGLTAHDAVTALIRDAMIIAQGKAPDTAYLQARLDEHRAIVDEAVDTDDLEDLITVRLTPLDPRRPARDLLEDLLAGIRGCRLLFGEYMATTNEDVDPDDKDYDQTEKEIDAEFTQQVRAKAAPGGHLP